MFLKTWEDGIEAVAGWAQRSCNLFINIKSQGKIKATHTVSKTSHVFGLKFTRKVYCLSKSIKNYIYTLHAITFYIQQTTFSRFQNSYKSIEPTISSHEYDILYCYGSDKQLSKKRQNKIFLRILQEIYFNFHVILCKEN